MSDELGPEEQALLRLARSGLSPASADQQRVLAGLLPQVAAPPVEAPSEQAMALSRPAEVGLFARSGRYLAGVLALGVAGAAGYGWGYRAGLAARSAPAVAPVVAYSTRPAPLPAPAPLPEPPAPEAQPAPEKSALRPLAHAGAPVPSGEPPSLDEEVRQLRRIERAIRDGNPRLALVLAEELERALPAGQLLIERRAAVMMAECQLRVEGAQARAALFIAGNPGSPFAARLRELCEMGAAEQRKSAPAGTNRAETGGSKK